MHKLHILDEKAGPRLRELTSCESHEEKFTQPKIRYGAVVATLKVVPRPHMSFVGGKGDAVDTESHDEDLVRFRASSDLQLCVGPLHLSRAQLPRPIRGRIQDNQVARVHVG